MVHGRHLHGWSSVGAKKVGAGHISPRAFQRNIVQYVGTLFVLEQSSLENGPREGGVMLTILYRK